MSNLARENQLISEEIDEDGVDTDELKIIDSLAQKKERKNEQLTTATNMEVQTGDSTREQLIVSIDLAVQFDDLEGEQ